MIFGTSGSFSGPKMTRKPAECYCEVIGGQIFLKFGTLVAGTSPKYYIFYFLKILILGRFGPFSGPKMARKPAECYCEVIGGQIFLKFGTLIAGTSPKCYVFYFFEYFDSWALGTLFGPKNCP